MKNILSVLVIVFIFASSASATSTSGCFTGKTSSGVELELKIDSTLHDPDAWDPHVAGMSVYQEITHLREGTFICQSSLEHNGNYYLGCSGRYYVIDYRDMGHITGRTFTSLKRFGPDGKLILPVLSEFELRSTECE